MSKEKQAAEIARLRTILKSVEREVTDPDVADKDLRPALLHIIRKGLDPSAQEA